MPFGEFLRSNNLPYIGEVVITPTGVKAEVKRYVFDAYCDCVAVYINTADLCGVFEWTFDQIRVCKREEN